MAPTYSDNSYPPSEDDQSNDDDDQWANAYSDDDLDSDFDSMASDDDGTDDMTGLGNADASFSAAGSDVDTLSGSFARMNVAPAPTGNRASAAQQNRAGGPSMCPVCGVRPTYSRNGKNYPTCGFTCDAKYKAMGSAGSGTSSGGTSSRGVGTTSSTTKTLCVVCGKRPAYTQGGKSYPTCGMTCGGKYKTGNFTALCVICGVKPAFSRNGKRYPTCGLTCAAKYRITTGNGGGRQTGGGGSSKLCVICKKRPCFRRGSVDYLTCGMTCLTTLCNGGGDNTKCNYCHRRPKLSPHNQCGRKCRDQSRIACLHCRCRPKLGKYHFCGRTCKKLAMKTTPKIVEIPKEHVTWKMVETKFNKAWKQGTRPAIKHVYKIIESAGFLQPYDAYRKRIGNEKFRYHGTSRQCKLGDTGQTMLCSQTNCAVCNILKTSFKVSLAKPSGAFGAGVYSSSASNKSMSYSNGVVLLTKVILGRIYSASRFNEVMSLPAGYNSVVFDRMNGTLNETIVYSDDAIRPVFLIVF
ncbi:uncharacterized protein FIBRA_05708 [Fibroporia radiculosa]|uniref:PARP catalytic domain-containing protein n=1 Tax=Fibroporia radiculosa TaxID=599839 RepID=J4HXZ7_9APHY|nr:uncharacterized protein FIBRA_05708 [Fibroporia radiculosa]CCM03572.1 predicted protein [Fibroporia radiculosa]